VLSPSLVLRLPASPASAAVARRAVEAREFASSGLLENVKLVVTELVTNAARHSPRPDTGPVGTITVHVRGSADHVLIEVFDAGPCFEATTTGSIPDLSESGMGLFLVARLAHRWGTEPRPGACRAWAELRSG